MEDGELEGRGMGGMVWRRKERWQREKHEEGCTESKWRGEGSGMGGMVEEGSTESTWRRGREGEWEEWYGGGKRGSRGASMRRGVQKA